MQLDIFDPIAINHGTVPLLPPIALSASEPSPLYQVLTHQVKYLGLFVVISK
jgi:hypothetical protein